MPSKATSACAAPSLENPNMPTGEIEVVADELLLLNEAKTPPFSPAEDAIANEEVRLKYRYLDLRRVRCRTTSRLRTVSRWPSATTCRRKGFLEIETPFMTRSTPEGARDYLVPSRVHPGEFYALPQSPQIFKQILMISGFDHYFQIVALLPRRRPARRPPAGVHPDRPGDDFPQQDTIFRVVEGFLTAAFAAAGIALTTPFVRMTYDEAIKNYGIDKPDMRLPGLTTFASDVTAEQLQTLKIEQTLPVVAFDSQRRRAFAQGARRNRRFSSEVGREAASTTQRLEKILP